MAIAIRIPGILGDCKLDGFDESWFMADSFSFGVEREFKESGEKGGTKDVNLGVGEMQECSISKSMDAASAYLAQASIQGQSLGDAEICFVEIAGETGGTDTGVRVYLSYKLHRCMIKSWSTSGDADDRPTEEVSFLYNKLAFGYAPHEGDNWTGKVHYMGWDNVKNKKWDMQEAALAVGANWKP
ncbi:Hcp family type VI secretion system effector [Aporhodopirellula aestuarii]|uniref:Type VI secretion system tube protein Hcp n=1 Tax=Aporhodopirellula aestuarii TaxID=2950107 RepID=A0ABT0TZR5_9BACT|nr:type VI secretion system tube protein Hcp [Aporhodopirellula aestuarii]MCM2369879.1 type VI secretion system tube protein Hcp [Aporhodopirellula aestuarii]